MSDTATTKNEQLEHRVLYHIIVNAQPKEVTDPNLTFNQIVGLSGYNPAKPNTAYDITYFNAVKPERDGILTEGGTVEVKDGTRFNVTETTKS
ncbi:multiubiquitin domain-containing protein [Ferrimicrobium sp.]|jgi:hypothetical protein|uniref:multiubiquitin domain-containing protein n=1 Tax=Ferrimicrobium sp. TaxID=2926050 RepID=UPI002630180D|nr:multiubiquitin domain-containing protein [Ferrimicrobium sp.]